MIPSKGVHFKQADRNDFKLMKKIIRKEDILELEAATGINYKKVIDETKKSTDFAVAGYSDGKLIALYGVRRASIITNSGIIWMFGTKFLPKNAKIFLKHCKKCVAVMLENYSLVYNYVDARNTMIINWLKWLGFVFQNPEPYGVKNMIFYRFYLENKI